MTGRLPVFCVLAFAVALPTRGSAQAWSDWRADAATPPGIADAIIVPTGTIRLRYHGDVLRHDGWRISLAAFGFLEDISLDTIRMFGPVTPFKRDVISHTFGIAWGVAEGWQVNAEVPIRRFSMDAILSDNTVLTERAAGIGDMEIGGRRNLGTGKGQRLDAGVDFVLPTGGRTPSASSEFSVLSYVNRPGSGSWGVQPNLAYVGQHGSSTWGVHVEVTRWLNDNSTGYRASGWDEANAWLGWRWFAGLGSTLRLEYFRLREMSGIDPALDTLASALYNAPTVPSRELDMTLSLSTVPTASPIGSRLVIEGRWPLYMEVIGIRRRWGLTAGVELALGDPRPR